MCATCPFRDDVSDKFKEVRGVVAFSAMTEASRICHNTGSNNAFHRRTGKPPMLCRGARDIQLKMFTAIGFISEPTDEAWASKRKELGV